MTIKKDWVVAASFGELILKGKNRSRFIKNAVDHIDLATRDLPVQERFFDCGKYFLAVEEKDLEPVVQGVKKVFGLVYITPSLRVDRKKDDIFQAAKILTEEKLKELKRENPQKDRFSFKVRTKRGDKSFPHPSPEVSAWLGGELLDAFSDLSVDVHHPDFIVHVEIRTKAFVYIDRVKGMGGLPWGSSGRGLLLLSGGIDSPAAGFAIARRGMAIGAVHFHAYPYTSERAKDKAVRLAAQMTKSVGPMRVYMINILDTYLACKEKCQPRNTTLLSRRMMMRIADVLCQRDHYDALITGESLGQVASQTVQSLSVINHAASHPILRPFIAEDKNQIIEISRKIGTYELSVLPYEDSCSIFAPDQPNTQPKLGPILEDEKKLDVQGLMEKALSSLEIIDPNRPEEIIFSEKEGLQ